MTTTPEPPPQFRVYHMYFGHRQLEKDWAMTAWYIAGIVAYWALLLIVVKRRSPGEA